MDDDESMMLLPPSNGFQISVEGMEMPLTPSQAAHGHSMREEPQEWLASKPSSTVYR